MMKRVPILFFALLVSFGLTAQEPCELVDYELSYSANPTACMGSSTGQATVASTGCDCMFSGCTFTWSDGQTFHTATGLAAGEYEVVIGHPVFINETDTIPDTCYMSINVIIEDGESLVLASSQTDVTCVGGADGSITLDISPLAGELEFNWTTGDTTQNVSGLSAGTYAVMVTNFENCSQELIFNIEDPEQSIEILEVITTASCAGLATGEVFFDVEGAVGTSTALIYDDDDNIVQPFEMAAGIYEVFITDENGCTAEAEFTIEEGELNFEILADNESICSGSSTNIEVLVDTEAIVNWFPATGISDPSSFSVTANPEVTTVYSVEVVANNGCTSTKQIEIFVNDVPNLSLTYNGNLTICPGEFINAFANVTGAVGYRWEPEEGVSNPMTNAVYLSPEVTTEYTVYGMLSNGCESSRNLIIEVEDCSDPTSIDDEFNLTTEIYPNPSFGVFHINIDGVNTDSRYEIFSLAGNKVDEGLIDYSQFMLDLTHLNSGVYLLSIINENGTYVSRLMKR